MKMCLLTQIYKQNLNVCGLAELSPLVFDNPLNTKQLQLEKRSVNPLTFS
jgi:hypothetical protein